MIIYLAIKANIQNWVIYTISGFIFLYLVLKTIGLSLDLIVRYMERKLKKINEKNFGKPVK